MRAFSLGRFLIFLAASTLAVAGTTVVGAPADFEEGNCVPFNCGSPNEEYQQVYTNSLFSGPITITGLEFFNTQFDNPGVTEMAPGTFTISLSTTTADWDTLSGTQANNIGGDNTEVFSGSLSQPWAFGDTLEIPFFTPFTYIPGQAANLLMDVVVTGLIPSQTSLVFLDTNGYSVANSIFGLTSTGGPLGTYGYAGYGLVTGFEITPEPATPVLFGIGLIALETLRRLRRVN